MSNLSPSYKTIARLFEQGRILKITIVPRMFEKIASSGQKPITPTPLVLTMDNLANLLPAQPSTPEEKLVACVTDIMVQAIHRYRGQQDVMWVCYQALMVVPGVQSITIDWVDRLADRELLNLIERWKRQESGTFPPSTPETERHLERLMATWTQFERGRLGLIAKTVKSKEELWGMLIANTPKPEWELLKDRLVLWVQFELELLRTHAKNLERPTPESEREIEKLKTRASRTQQSLLSMLTANTPESQNELLSGLMANWIESERELLSAEQAKKC